MRSWFFPLLALAILAAIMALGLSSPLWREASLEIDFGHGVVRSFRGPLFPSMNLRQALFTVAEVGGFDIVFDRNTGSILSIDGVVGSWEVMKNGESILLPLADIPVLRGDKVALRYLAP